MFVFKDKCCRLTYSPAGERIAKQPQTLRLGLKPTSRAYLKPYSINTFISLLVFTFQKRCKNRNKCCNLKTISHIFSQNDIKKMLSATNRHLKSLFVSVFVNALYGTSAWIVQFAETCIPFQGLGGRTSYAWHAGNTLGSRCTGEMLLKY